MHKRLSGHVRANVVGYVAVFIAMSGAAYAVDGPLPGTNQVGTSDIIDNEVRTADIRDDTIVDGDIAPEAVRGNEIRNSSVGALDLTDGGITARDIQNSGNAGDPVIDGPSVFENLAVQEAQHAQFLMGPDTSTPIIDPEDVYTTEDRGRLFVEWQVVDAGEPVETVVLGGPTGFGDGTFELELACTATDVAERIRYRGLPQVALGEAFVWQDVGAADTDFFRLQEGEAMPGFNSSSTAVEDGPGGSPDMGDHVEYTILRFGSEGARVTTVDVTAVKTGVGGSCYYAITATNAFVDAAP